MIGMAGIMSPRGTTRAASSRLMRYSEYTCAVRLGVLIAGIVVGLLGKLFAPGEKDNTPLWLTLLCGIGGAFFGWIIYDALGGDGSAGVHWGRWIAAILCAAILVGVAAGLTGRNKLNLP